MRQSISKPAARLLLVAAILFGLSGVAAAAATPLRVTATPTAVVPGGSVVVGYTVQRVPAKLVLRLDGEQLRSVRVRESRGRIAVTLPRDAAAGAHRLSACVGKACRTLTLRVNRKPQADPPPAAPPSAPPAGTPPTPQPPPAVDFSGAPNPLDVQAHTDASRRATATIDSDGGTLETTGADGTHYELTVPFGALLSEERISMAPISSVDGLPFAGGLVAGVQLEPSGLRFNDLVTLEISGHAQPPAQQETGFLFQQDGDEFQLYPELSGPAKTTFKIMHFSGVGIARGTEAERNAQLLRATTDVEGRLFQQLGSAIRGEQPASTTGVEATLRAYHDQVLKPLVDAAVIDDGLATQALNRYFGWSRLVVLLTDSENEFMLAERATLAQQFVGILKNAAIKAHQRCVDESRPEELPAILAWWRTLALADDGIEMPTDLWTAISSCARFELDFHTKLVQERGINIEGPELWKGEALAENVIISPDPLTLQQSGTKDAQYVDFRIEVPPHKPGTGCWRGSDEWTSTFPFVVSRLEIDLNPIQRPDGTYGYPAFERGRIKLSVMPFLGAQEHTFFADCGGASGKGWDSWLAVTFRDLHEDEEDEQFGGTVFTDWTVPTGGGSMLGAKTYFRTKTIGGVKTREETTLELYHAPTG